MTTTKKNFVFAFISLFAMLLTALGISFAFPSQKADSAIDWTGHSYTKFTPYSTTDGVYLSPIEDNARLGFVVVVVGGYSLIGGSYNGFMTTSAGATCGIDGTTYEGAQHQGTNTNYYDIRYRIEAYAQSNVYIRQARVAAKNASGFYALYTDTDYGINSTTTSFEYGDTVNRDDTFGTVEGSGAYDINMLYDLVLVYEYFINGNSVRVSAGSVADELAGGLGAATTVNPADYERDGYALEGFWTGENKTGTQVLDADGYFVNDYAYTPGATLYPGYTQAFYFDINNTLDGKDNEASQYFTFSLDVDGETVAQNVNDFYQPIKVGQSIEVYDIECVDGYSFIGSNASNSSAVNSSSTSSHIHITMPEEDMDLTLNFMSGAFWTDDAVQEKLNVDFDNYSLSGSGTEEAPYLIQSETDLAFLSWTIYNDKVFGGSANKFTSGLDSYFYSDITFKQTKDLDLSVYYWQPIGIRYTRDGTSASRYFSGNYDGGGYTVSVVFTPEGTGNGYSYQGLFGYVWSQSETQLATIQNVGVIDSFIQGSQYIGGVVGYAYGDVTITNCYNTGSVSGSSGYVGGVAGYGNATNCYNTGTVSSSGEYVGGVAGYSQSNTSTLINCYNTGSVSGSSYIGGVAGRTYGDVSNCYNTGSVSGTGDVGGVVGYADVDSTIINCYNTGSVTEDKGCVGGVVGYVHRNATITNCYNTGAVSGSVGVGGVVGMIYGGTIQNCLNFGNVSGNSNVVGGVVGSASSSIITNCGVEGGVISGSSYVGIFVGSITNSSTAIQNCYAIVNEALSPYGINSGTFTNCLWIAGVVKYRYGTDFSAFAWLNPNSCPIPKGLSLAGQFWTGDITNEIMASSKWTEWVA